MGASTSRLDPSSTPAVAIPGHGKIQGTSVVDTQSSKAKAHRYTGIPYALPPVGERRWRKPCPLPDSFCYDADSHRYTEFGDICPQPGNYSMDISPSPPVPTGRSFSEDCLLLNVWVPAGPPPSSGFPVLFFIHGGWLQVGNPHHDIIKDPSDLIAPVNEGGAGLQAIVVSPGYRLGIFGFLAMDCMDAGERGNFGFYDQRLALEWTHDNIGSFGGNPANITLGGLSAGAHSAHSQALFEFKRLQHTRSKPLFRRLFLQSNAAMVPAKNIDETVEQVAELCRQLGISPELKPSQRLEELRKRSAEELIEIIPSLHLHTFRAVRGEGEFVDVDWSSIMLDGRFARWCKAEGIDILMGECSDEESVYRLVNPPAGLDFASSLRCQLHNYYPLTVVDQLLSCYPTPSPSAPQGDWADVFGWAASDSQVYASERLFVETLVGEGPSILRYQIAYRPAFLDRYSPSNMGVGHSFDDSLWWFSKAALLEARNVGEDEKRLMLDVYRQWLGCFAAFVHGDANACERWYGQPSSSPDLIHGRAVRRLGADMTVSVAQDDRWASKKDVIAVLRRAATAATAAPPVPPTSAASAAM